MLIEIVVTKIYPYTDLMLQPNIVQYLYPINMSLYLYHYQGYIRLIIVRLLLLLLYYYNNIIYHFIIIIKYIILVNSQGVI